MSRMTLFFIMLLTCGYCSLTFAGTGGAGGAGGAGGYDGGAGADGADGKPGMAGCPGGTAPAADGKFYLPGTRQECNPGPQDLDKIKGRSGAGKTGQQQGGREDG